MLLSTWRSIRPRGSIDARGPKICCACPSTERKLPTGVGCDVKCVSCLALDVVARDTAARELFDSHISERLSLSFFDSAHRRGERREGYNHARDLDDDQRRAVPAG